MSKSESMVQRLLLITISGSLFDSGQKIKLSIADTGHGITPEELPQIFEPFYSTKKDGKGVGLGLSMVYGIIREHSGTIEVRSDPGQGTVFTITLPTQPIPLDEKRGTHDTHNADPGGG